MEREVNEEEARKKREKKKEKKKRKREKKKKRKRGHRLCSSLYFCTPTERLIIACSAAQMNR